MGYIIIGLIIALIISCIIANKFASIAEMKGHNGTSYFWFTFLFGIAGMLMVIALPNIKSTETNNNSVCSNTNMTKNIDLQSSIPVSKATSDLSASSSGSDRVQSVLSKITNTEHVKNNNKTSLPLSAKILDGEKICPKCGQAQKIDRVVCWSCGQRFDN